MFGLVLGVFSAAFLVLIAIVLQPDFEIAPDTSSEQVAQRAYRAAVERMGVALGLADVIAITTVGIGAWLLAARTLRPIGEAHERQRRFVADASHEMRTPLTVICVTTDNAMNGTNGADGRRQALATISTAAAELTRLTADLLTLAQSDDQIERRGSQHFDLSVAVSERLAVRAIAGDKSLSRTTFAADLVVEGNAEEIGRICDNLVDNAFRYGGPGVHVAVTTRLADHQAVLEVADDGPGIALADQTRIFEPFFRVHADADAPDGSGLGLAIAMALARRNRGRLTVDSAPAKGAVFRLQLPLAG